MPPAPIQIASDAAESLDPEAVPVVVSDPPSSSPAVAQVGGFAAPDAGVRVQLADAEVALTRIEAARCVLAA